MADEVIDFMAADPEAVVELWKPQIGQRVRVTGAIAECPHTGVIRNARTGRPRHSIKGHDMRALNAIGTVTAGRSLTRPNHDVPVAFDPPVNGLYAGSYAACELEPLS